MNFELNVETKDYCIDVGMYRLRRVPRWVDEMHARGVDIKVFTCPTNNVGPRVIVVRKVNRKTNAGTDTIYVVPEGYSLECRAMLERGMRKVWKHMLEVISCPGSQLKADDFSIAEDGSISQNGHPLEREALTSFIYVVKYIYSMWQPFQNVDDWDVVKKLNDAADAVEKLRLELVNGYIASEIAAAKKSLADAKRKLGVFEKAMNNLYEDAADGLNFLEEYGYHREIDMDGNVGDEQ